MAHGAPSGRSNLALRVAASVVMIPLAIAVAWWGGWPFAVFWAIAGIIVFLEWIGLVAGGRMRPAAWTAQQWCWVAAGLAYALLLVLATLTLRADMVAGLAAILFLFAVVWMTDIAAYFTGRALGGPKLWSRISPKKTWSGAIGGVVAGTVSGGIVAAGFGYGALGAVMLVAFALSVISQAGDLFESTLKRHFGAKDASQLIPGHGGLLDRLDGFAAAVMAAAILGVARAGLDASGRGLLEW